MTDHSEEIGIEINVKWVYLLRMIQKVESTDRWCGTLLSNSKGQMEIPQYEFVVSQIDMRFCI